LNHVQPHDWGAFLRARVDSINPRAPLDGITRGGYKLVYTDTPTAWFKSFEKDDKITSFQYFGGFVLGKDGEVTAVGWDSPAFNAGLTIGSKLIAVNGRALAVGQLNADIKAKNSPLSLLVKTGDVYRTVELHYDGGLRYPKLERIGFGPSSLDALLTAQP